MNKPLAPAVFPMRINKFLAHSGLASRREADELISQGKVLINNQPAIIGQQVEQADEVHLVGELKPKSYYAYYKGRGIITHSPATGEIDIATRLKQDYGLTNMAPVGRLDKDSEGLIILTDDGRVTQPLLDPDGQTEKEYEVMVDKPMSAMALRIMAAGVDIEGYRTKPANTERHSKNNRRFTIILTEGKKHQIRRMCAALGYQVQSLKRIRVLNIKLNTLKPNQFRKIKGTELKEFLTSLHLQ